MKRKQLYEAPETELTVVLVEEHFLDSNFSQGNNSIESMDVDDPELDW